MSATDPVAQTILRALENRQPIPCTVREIQDRTWSLTNGQIRRRLIQMEEAGMVRRGRCPRKEDSRAFCWRPVQQQQ